MKNVKTVILNQQTAKDGSSLTPEPRTSVAHLTHSSSHSTVAIQKPRKGTTLTATFEFLELPKDMEDNFYRDNAQIFLKGEQERMIQEKHQRMHQAFPGNRKK